jgi:squalene-hopene/tetraprenyl-beta-curcumene cyclase
MTPRPLPWRTLPLLFLAACAAGCPRAAPPGPPRPGLTGRIDRAAAAGVRFLLARQSPDGAWRSDVYGQFKAGDALTPLVLDALLALDRDAPLDGPRRRGSAWLAALAPGGAPADRDPLIYPSYTAALAVRVLNDPRNAGHARARDAWRSALLRQQLTEQGGWSPADAEYGGWGYAAREPRKPGPGEPRDPLLPPNLSATAYAAAALRSAGGPGVREALAKALRFVGRCQNLPQGSLKAAMSSDPAFDDGGFFFLPEDDGRNKAGAGVDGAGRPRFHSYGSATADGLAALLACGAARDDPRVRAAVAWVRRHAKGRTHPGAFEPVCEAKRPALFFYYAASLASALAALGEPAAHARLTGELAESLMGLQRPDGSWESPHALVREDDPVVATALALRALAACKMSASGGTR